MSEEGPKPVLSYGDPAAQPWVVVGQYEQEEHAAPEVELLLSYHFAMEMVPTVGTTNYAAGTQEKIGWQLRVRPDMAERAKNLLTWPEDLSTAAPSKGDAHDQPIPIPGRDEQWMVLARYDTAREMVDHATLLGSEHVDVLLPRLVVRGSADALEDPAPGRFILRVRQAHLDNAERLLAELEVDGIDDGDPRCPRCGSWQVDGVVTRLPVKIWAMFLGLPTQTRMMQCRKCSHTGLREAFESESEKHV